jgi:hypothetical protein
MTKARSNAKEKRNKANKHAKKVLPRSRRLYHQNSSSLPCTMPLPRVTRTGAHHLLRNGAGTESYGLTLTAQRNAFRAVESGHNPPGRQAPWTWCAIRDDKESKTSEKNTPLT